MQTEHIYFITEAIPFQNASYLDQIRVKIGKTKRAIETRMKELQTGNAEQLRLFFSMKREKALKGECALHKILSQQRTQGEWFTMTKAQLLNLKQTIQTDWMDMD